MKNIEEYETFEECLAVTEARLADLKERGDAAVGDNVIEFMRSTLTDEEIAESNIRIALMNELIKARQNKDISPKELAEMSGVKKPVIEKMEKQFRRLTQ